MMKLYFTKLLCFHRVCNKADGRQVVVYVPVGSHIRHQPAQSFHLDLPVYLWTMQYYK